MRARSAAPKLPTTERQVSGVDPETLEALLEHVAQLLARDYVAALRRGMEQDAR